jgi:hypothetical protein
MDPDRHEILRAVGEQLSRVSSWLASRRRPGDESAPEEVRHAIASGRAALDDMEHDYEAPPAHVAFRREELQALRRHLGLTARLLSHLSNVDDPDWEPARAEVDRSWDEMRRAFETPDGPPSDHARGA